MISGWVVGGVLIVIAEYPKIRSKSALEWESVPLAREVTARGDDDGESPPVTERVFLGVVRGAIISS